MKNFLQEKHNDMINIYVITYNKMKTQYLSTQENYIFALVNFTHMRQYLSEVKLLNLGIFILNFEWVS